MASIKTPLLQRNYRRGQFLRTIAHCCCACPTYSVARTEEIAAQGASKSGKRFVNSLSLTIPAAISAVRTRPLFSTRFLASAPVVVGQVHHGERRATFIESGSFEGDRLRGQVLGGMDWQLVRDDGAFELDIKLMMRTDDGKEIAMSCRGLRCGPQGVMDDLAKGVAVDPSQYYFRVQASFEASDPELDWLNRIFAIGLGHRLPDGPLYNFFELL